jgi:hypothetical protein
MFRGERCRGEGLSMERTASGREASWREGLHGENLSMERLFEEKGALERAQPARSKCRAASTYSHLLIYFLLQQFTYTLV